ncbi:Syringolide-induced protein 14-1-1 [Quillaja saponaria]|uniref:Syringolide-induced protein 14-1-1 n=1 Tax=Quillaja saponaria TaxID=32244 RepID=A0AAD7L7V4_QUISA|nr:Syringolide-induced protein 14-1-1 [Quillaja saponaria]
MESLSKLKTKISKLLPQSVAAVTFQGPPSSPTTSRGSRSSAKISIIPREARRRPKNGSFDAREPTSPKVSCMGQVKHMKKKKKTSKHKLVEPPPEDQTLQVSFPEEVKNEKKKKKKQKQKQKKTSNGGLTLGGDQSLVLEEKKLPLPERIPSLGELKQFSSARGTLSSFDFTVTGT